MDATLSSIDWSVLILSVVFVAAMGGWFARRQKSTEQYFVGGRSVPGWAAGLSLFASSISTITFLAYPGHGYGGDWTRLMPGLMLPPVILLVSLVILPFYRRVVRLSAYEYLEQRFGYPARAYAAVLYLLMNLFRLSFVLFLSAQAIHIFTQWDIRAVILVSGVITIVYTVLGGFEAVIWTDVLQSFVLLAGGLLCVILLLLSSADGPVQTMQMAYQAGKFHLADFSLDLTRPTILVMVLYGLFGHAGGYVTTQDSVQRYLATPTLKAARRGLWLGSISCVLTWTMFMLIGTLLYVYHVRHPGQLPASIAGEETKVFPHFVMTRFPRGAIGLVLAAMVAAAMSTLSAVMNSMSMVTVCDFAQRLWPRSDRHQLLLGKLATCLWGVVGTATALSMLEVRRALDFSYTVSSILSGGLLGVFMLAFVYRRARPAGIYAGLAAGVLVTAWGTLDELTKLGLPLPALPTTVKLPWLGVPLSALKFPFHTFLLIACANMASFAVGLVVCSVLPRRSGAPEGGTLWDLRTGQLDREDLLGDQRDLDAAV